MSIWQSNYLTPVKEATDMTKRRILTMLLTMCMAFSMLYVPAMASGDVIWSQDTVLSRGNDYDNATIAPGVRVEIQTGILVRNTLTVGAGGKLVGEGLFFPEVGTGEVVGMTMYYRVAGAYKPFKDGLKTLWDANLWPGYAPNFVYDSASDIWYLYQESGDFDADPFYTNTGAVNSSGGRNINSAMNSACALNMLGLFPISGANPGGGADYDLARKATNSEAVMMLVRLLGKEKTATSGNWVHPFTDVSATDKYVGYAYQNGLVTGSSATTLGTGGASAQMYLSMVLRALGYSEAAGDFVSTAPEQLASQIGLLPADVSLNNFIRADIAMVSEAALGTKLKGSNLTLGDRLISEGVFTKAQYDSAMAAR